jgi:hypothetical protein
MRMTAVRVQTNVQHVARRHEQRRTLIGGETRLDNIVAR